MSRRLLFCSSTPLTRTLGASKVPIELADAMRQQGWAVDLVGPEDFVPRYKELTWPQVKDRINDGLRNLIAHEGKSYDVIDYQVHNLPYERNLFPERTLLSARTPLLHAHFDRIEIPQPINLRSLAEELVRGGMRQRKMRAQIKAEYKTAKEADLVVVNNDEDREELVRLGISDGRVQMVPLGLSDERLRTLKTGPDIPPNPPTVAFVGTFDWRKGAADFADLVKQVRSEVPSVRFRLLGTQGVFREERDVRRLFSKDQQECLDIVPRFAPETLPDLLRTCSVGVFPSYLEGFGFGVLEMLAASLPVVAYDAPGPPVMLPQEWLVPRGDTAAAAGQIVRWLKSDSLLRTARSEARSRAEGFTWETAANKLGRVYIEAIGRMIN